MPTVPYTGPRLVSQPGIDSPLPRAYAVGQLSGGGLATFREGDFLQLVTTGTITAPTGGLGTLAVAGTLTPGPALAATQGPVNVTASSFSLTSGNYTITATTSAGAPALTYYVACSYTKTGAESMLGTPFPINVSAGLKPIVQVNTAAQPSTTTNFALYAGFSPSNLALQQATTTTTATGSSFTISVPLVNSAGVAQGATNMSSNIAGIAIHGSDQAFAPPMIGGIGGSVLAGLASQAVGTWANPSPIGSSQDPGQALVISLANGVPFEISLVQGYTDALLQQTAGFNLDATTGIFTADTTQAAKPITIQTHPFGASLAGTSASYQNALGGVGDTGARVTCILNSGTI